MEQGGKEDKKQRLIIFLKFLGIASGSMMAGMPPSYGNSPMSRGTSYDLVSSSICNKYSNGGPLSHLSESVNSLDPLNAMEKSLNEQVSTNTAHLTRVNFKLRFQ